MVENSASTKRETYMYSIYVYEAGKIYGTVTIKIFTKVKFK